MAGTSFWVWLLGLGKHLSLETSAVLSASLCSIFQCPQKSTQIRGKQLTGWCSRWFLERDIHAQWICPALAQQIFPYLFIIYFFSIGNGSCVWVACSAAYFAFHFHLRMSKEKFLPPLWPWKDFVARVSQRALLDSRSWGRDGFLAEGRKG